MKKRWLAAIAATALVCSFSTAQVFAADGAASVPMFGHGMYRQALTDEEKAQMEAAMAERKAQEEAFLATLTEEQKVMYDALHPARPEIAEGERPEKPDEAAMEAARDEMQEKLEAFTASLTDEQKAEWEALMPRGPEGGMREGFSATEAAATEN